MHKSSYNKMKNLLTKFVFDDGIDSGKVLDFGSYDINGTYKDFFEPKAWQYVGLDMNSGQNVDIVPKNSYEWNEIPDEQFDLVISGQALEHCEFFWLIFKEIERVLKPGGKCIAIAPSGGHEHQFPVDCWRFYPDGMRALCKYVNFEVLSVETDWEPIHYDDDSHLWKDTSLVAQKTSK